VLFALAADERVPDVYQCFERVVRRAKFGPRFLSGFQRNEFFPGFFKGMSR
jgi:hypothetical protein